MTGPEISRIEWHLEVPVCRTLRGTRRHLELIGIRDLALLCRWFGCSAVEITERLWAWAKGPKRIRDCRNCDGRAGGCNVDGLCSTDYPLFKGALNAV